jgi:HEAT repeat protein
MLRIILTAALTAAFIEVGAQTPPPAPPALPTPAAQPPQPTARAPRAPEVGDLRTPRPLLPPGFDEARRDMFDRELRMEEVQRALSEVGRIDQDEVRRLAREAREEVRMSLEMNREHIEEARLQAEHVINSGLFDRYDFPTPMPVPAIAPLPSIAPIPPLPPIPADSWDNALRRFETAMPAPHVFEQPFFERSSRGPGIIPRAAWLPQDPADSLYRMGREHLTRGQYRSAAETFKLLSAKYPSSGYAPDGMYYEAFSLYKIGGQNELRAALAVLEKQKSRFPKQDNPDPALPTRIRGELANRGDRVAAEAVANAAAGQGQPCNKEEMAVRIEALNALSRMNVDSTTPILRRVLSRRDDCSISLRRQAITLMAKNPDAATTDLMIDVLKNDPSMEVRRAALSWLGEVPSDRGAAALDEILRTPKDEELQGSALRALASSRNPKSVPALRSVIERKDVSDGVRYEAMIALTRNDSVNAGAYLRSVYPKLENRQLQSRALTAIGRMRDPDTQKWMLAFVRDTTQPVELRRAALSTLTRSSVTTVAEVGGLYAQVPELELRQQIITSLANRKEPEAVDQLIAIYRGTTDTKLKMQIINVLSRRDDPRTQKLLIEILNK